MTPETLIRSTKGRLFTVTFVKRSDNTLRCMTARTGVTRYLRGGPRAYDPADHNLISVFEVTPRPRKPGAPFRMRRESEGYKAIPLDAILTITYAHRTYTFTEQQQRAA